MQMSMINGRICLGVGCSCPIGFVGQNCQQRVHLCGSNFCKNGGTCLQAGSTTICLCSSGHSGMYCERSTFESCVQSPCLNDGVCRDTTAGFRCGCRGSTAGDRCELTGDICHHDPCLNDGRCVNYCGGRTRLCFCRGDYMGDICQEGPVPSTPPPMGPGCGAVGSPCVNGGSCFVDGKGGMNCLCPEGFTGKRCEAAKDACGAQSQNPCRHGGTCFDVGNGLYKCFCRAGYFGHTCEKVNVTCNRTAPCLNQGVCSPVQPKGSFACKCPPGFTGLLCGERETVRPCFVNPCLNNGTCVDIFVGASLAPSSSTASPLPTFTCICAGNFSGKNCEIPPVNPCISWPCLNGGTCLVSVSRLTSKYKSRILWDKNSIFSSKLNASNTRIGYSRTSLKCTRQVGKI